MTAKDFNNCIARIRNGDNRGLEPIFDFYYKKLVASGSFFGLTKEMSQDAASVVILNIFKYAGDIKYIDNPDGWMNTLFKHVAIDVKRKLNYEVLTDFSDFDMPDDNDKTDFEVMLRAAMMQCTERQRFVADMFYLQDLLMNEIAEILEVSASTIKRDLRIVKKLLGNLLKEKK